MAKHPSCFQLIIINQLKSNSNAHKINPLNPGGALLAYVASMGCFHIPSCSSPLTSIGDPITNAISYLHGSASWMLWWNWQIFMHGNQNLLTCIGHQSSEIMSLGILLFEQIVGICWINEKEVPLPLPSYFCINNIWCVMCVRYKTTKHNHQPPWISINNCAPNIVVSGRHERLMRVSLWESFASKITNPTSQVHILSFSAPYLSLFVMCWPIAMIIPKLKIDVDRLGYLPRLHSISISL